MWNNVVKSRITLFFALNDIVKYWRSSRGPIVSYRWLTAWERLLLPLLNDRKSFPGQRCENFTVDINANHLATTFCAYYNVTCPKSTYVENLHRRSLSSALRHRLTTISLAEFQQVAALLSILQIIQASLCYCWRSISQLLFHRSGALCLNMHLLRVHFTWRFLQ